MDSPRRLGSLEYEAGRGKKRKRGRKIEVVVGKLKGSCGGA